MNLLKQTAIKNGILIWLLLGSYFLLLDMLGLSDFAYLKIVNILIIMIGVNLTLRHFAKKDDNYGVLFGKGIKTAFIGVALALLSLVFYFEVLLGGVDISQYSTTIIPTTSLSQYVLALFAEGLATAVIVVFVLLQYWKNYAENKRKLSKESI
ncbi:MAG: hypothetical protein JJT77_13940 [Crocinitomicaceae bacterium]|nr:hypothetical protein [Crocinitomicaceae bacterium]